MGRHSRQKGKRGEREAVKVARDLLYADDAWRTAQVMGKDGGMADVQDVLDGFHVEVKRYAQIGVYRWLAQAERDMKPGERPLLMLRADHQDWLFCFRAQDVDDFVQAYLANQAAADRQGGRAADERTDQRPGREPRVPDPLDDESDQ